MRKIADIVKSRDGNTRFFHVRLVEGRNRFLHERIVERNIGPRPWSEASWVDKDGRVNELFAK